MSADPTVAPDCTCPVIESEIFGETVEYDPGCPEHGMEAVLEAPPPCGMDGCCTACEGTGRTYDSSTGGMCWDCRGTGHPHDRPAPSGEAAEPTTTDRGE